MATASYRTPQAPEKCRAPRLTLTERIHRGEVARTLDELCALGLVEKFRDEFGIERYRSLRTLLPDESERNVMVRQ